MRVNIPCFIYALVDPRETDIIRYIGKTMNPEKRLNDHIKNSKYLKCRRSSWIISLLRDGVKPLMKIVLMCDESVWQEFERTIIARFKTHKLTNGNEGGIGGGIPEEWVKEKISRARKLIAPKISASLSIAIKEKWKDPDYRKRLSLAQVGRKQSKEQIEKRMIRMRGRVHSEIEKKNRSVALIKQRGVKIRNMDTGQIFDSLADAADSVGKPRNYGPQLATAIKRNKPNIWGFFWERL